MSMPKEKAVALPRRRFMRGVNQAEKKAEPVTKYSESTIQKETISGYELDWRIEACAVG
jgi:hypothetical protein